MFLLTVERIENGFMQLAQRLFTANLDSSRHDFVLPEKGFGDWPADEEYVERVEALLIHGRRRVDKPA